MVDENATSSVTHATLPGASGARWVRPTTPEDGPAIVALMRQAGLEPHADPAHLRWKYWQEHPDWHGPRSFALTDGRDLLAHGALVPGTLRTESTRQRMIHMIDWCARRESVGAGVVLMKHVGRQADFLLGIGGSEQTRKIMPLIGYRFCGEVTGYVRPLSPARLMRTRSGPRWKLAPRFARSVVWSLSAPRAEVGVWRTRRIAAEEVDQMGPILSEATSGSPVLERSPALFRYALACPIVPLELHALEKAGRIGGYFVLSRTPGQARLADLGMDSLDPEDWRALVNWAVREACAPGTAAETAAWSNDARLSQALGDCGFHARFTLPIYLRGSAGAAVPQHPLRVQMLDNDAFYLYDGSNPLWA